MALNVKTIIVPGTPYPEDTPHDRLDRTDTFRDPGGRYYGECGTHPDDAEPLPEGHRAVLAIQIEVSGFRYRIYRMATREEVESLLWK